MADDDERLVEFSWNTETRQVWLRAKGTDGDGATLEPHEIHYLAAQLAAIIGCRLIEARTFPPDDAQVFLSDN